MKKIRWVIQSNLSAEGGDYQQITKACDELGIECEGIIVIPFSPDIPEFTQDDKINIYYGATTLMYNIYHKMGNPTGLFFDEERFSMGKYNEIWGDYMLNGPNDGKITTFKEFSLEDHPDDTDFFIRPDADDKSFDGEVRSFFNIKKFITNAIKYDNVILTEDTKILISKPYNIEKEWRNYIVDGKVVTSSMYRKNFRLHKDAFDIPEGMIKFVEDRCKEYQPHSIFAMDIALCGGDYYIIECGCLNSVGLYHADVKKMIKEVTNFIENEDSTSSID
jgi:hypothetical protein